MQKTLLTELVNALVALEAAETYGELVILSGGPVRAALGRFAVCVL
jgi:hypothetical protein